MFTRQINVDAAPGDGLVASALVQWKRKREGGSVGGGGLVFEVAAQFATETATQRESQSDAGC